MCFAMIFDLSDKPRKGYLSDKPRKGYLATIEARGERSCLRWCEPMPPGRPETMDQSIV
jgi:hypothetical protein